MEPAEKIICSNYTSQNGEKPEDCFRGPLDTERLYLFWSSIDTWPPWPLTPTSGPQWHLVAPESTSTQKHGVVFSKSLLIPSSQCIVTLVKVRGFSGKNWKKKDQKHKLSVSGDCPSFKGFWVFKLAQVWGINWGLWFFYDQARLLLVWSRKFLHMQSK